MVGVSLELGAHRALKTDPFGPPGGGAPGCRLTEGRVQEISSESQRGKLVFLKGLHGMFMGKLKQGIHANYTYAFREETKRFKSRTLSTGLCGNSARGCCGHSCFPLRVTRDDWSGHRAQVLFLRSMSASWT